MNLHTIIYNRNKRILDLFAMTWYTSLIMHHDVSVVLEHLKTLRRDEMEVRRTIIEGLRGTSAHTG